MLPNEHKTAYADLLRTTGREVDAGVVAATNNERIRYWQCWSQYIAPFRGVDTMLTNVTVPIRIEFIYHAQFTQPDKESGLGYSDNIYRINIKLGINKGILGSLYNPDLDD